MSYVSYMDLKFNIMKTSRRINSVFFFFDCSINEQWCWKLEDL